MAKWAELDEMPTLNGKIVMALMFALAIGFNMTYHYGDNNVSHPEFHTLLP